MKKRLASCQHPQGFFPSTCLYQEFATVLYKIDIRLLANKMTITFPDFESAQCVIL